MPIFMDRHDMPGDISAVHVAQMHQEDLKIEHQFGCRGLTYWCDEQRKTAFCLIEAPNIQAIQKMHNHAHGDVPHRIIEVNSDIVESFLGRIEDPKKSQNSELNIINDPAFRIIMVIGIKKTKLIDANHKSQLYYKLNQSVFEIVKSYEGSIVSQKSDYFLISFESVTKAMMCSIEIQTKFKGDEFKAISSGIELGIGLSAGVPITKKENIFEDTIKIAERLCDIVDGPIAITNDVKDLYESENLNQLIDNKFVNTIQSNEEIFLNLLMDYTEKEWINTSLNVDDISKGLGYSKSQLYRKMIAVTGKSPNNFLKNYRLNKALKLLDKQMGNISEIAFKTGFNSPAYFSKCFLNAYGVLPSIYSKQHQN